MNNSKSSGLNIKRNVKLDPQAVMALTMILDELDEDDKKKLIDVLEKEGHKIDIAELYKKLDNQKT